MALSVLRRSPFIPELASPGLPALMGAVCSAKESLVLCLAQVTSAAFIDAVSLRAREGVAIRWITGPDTDTLRLLAARGFLEGEDIDVVDATGPGWTDFVVADAKHLLLGLSPTLEALHLRHGLAWSLESEELATAFTEAARVFGQGKGDHAPAVVSHELGRDRSILAAFTPFDGPATLEIFLDTLAQAEEEVWFALATLEDPRVLGALVEAAAKGVEVRGVVGTRPDGESARLLRNAPAELVLRWLKPFSQEDTYQQNAVFVDGRWSFGGGLAVPPGVPSLLPGCAWVIDAPTLARSGVEFCEALFNLAKTGGQTRERCRGYLAYQAELVKLSHSLARAPELGGRRTLKQAA